MWTFLGRLSAVLWKRSSAGWKIHLPMADPTIFVALFVRNKAHLLPAFLQSFGELIYDKRLMDVWIVTNNNTDSTQSVLEDWVQRAQHKYKSCALQVCHFEELEKDTSSAHEWSAFPHRLQIMSQLRNESLTKCIECGAELYFTCDVDCFLQASWLTEAVTFWKQQPQNERVFVLSPRLQCVGSPGYLNFALQDYCLQWQLEPHFDFALDNANSIVPVALVHNVYLMDAKVCAKTTYNLPLSSAFWEYIAFALSCHQAEVPHLLDNRRVWGYFLHGAEQPQTQEVAALQLLKARKKKESLPIVVFGHSKEQTQKSIINQLQYIKAKHSGEHSHFYCVKLDGSVHRRSFDWVICKAPLEKLTINNTNNANWTKKQLFKAHARTLLNLEFYSSLSLSSSAMWKLASTWCFTGMYFRSFMLEICSL